MNKPFVSNDPRYFPNRQLIAERELCSQLRSQLFYLWTFVAQQDLWEDAFDFLDEHYDPNTPVDFLLTKALY
jgi:hypothetical protein